MRKISNQNESWRRGSGQMKLVLVLLISHEPTCLPDRSCISISVVRCQQASLAVAGCGCVLHGVSGHHHSEHGSSSHLGRPPRHPPQHEGRIGQLHVEPCCLHSHQWLDGGPVRNAPRVRFRDRPLHPWIISLRHIERHPFACRLSRPAGLRRSDDGPGRQAHPGAVIRQIRTPSHHELRRHSSSGCSHARSHCRRPDRRLFPLAAHFFSKHSNRRSRLSSRLSAPARLSGRAHAPA
jgi:hypothetical protein